MLLLLLAIITSIGIKNAAACAMLGCRPHPYTVYRGGGGNG